MPAFLPLFDQVLATEPGDALPVASPHPPRDGCFLQIPVRPPPRDGCFPTDPGASQPSRYRHCHRLRTRPSTPRRLCAPSAAPALDAPGPSIYTQSMPSTSSSSAKRPALIAPSILSADFSKLGQEVEEVAKAGADWLHVDVMDGHFVPNLTIGPVVVEAIKPLTKLPMDCHLMVSRPEEWVAPFAKAGANIITVHAEASNHLDRLLRHIRAQGCEAGVSINPATPVSAIEEVLDLVDLVLVMSVNPGFGGQKFIESTLGKVRRLAELKSKHNFLIQIDGGVSPQTVGACYEAGVDCFVAGSAIFSAQDRAQAIRALRDGI
jgi:ribulose-phosphate 3-epimerase